MPRTPFSNIEDQGGKGHHLDAQDDDGKPSLLRNALHVTYVWSRSEGCSCQLCLQCAFPDVPLISNRSFRLHVYAHASIHAYRASLGSARSHSMG
jgi:hypothetical protein